MPITRQSSAIRKSNSFSLISATLFGALTLLHSSGAIAQGRAVTITESTGASTHSYPSPMIADKAGNDPIRKPAAVRQINSHNYNFWINQASVRLNTDHDHDGHYSSFTLTVDVDTHLVAPAVYAVLYLSLTDNNWIEYAVSSNFTVRGSGSFDAFTIDADLDSGYPSGYYNHYIEIYDAYTHDFLIGHGPGESSAFYGLPIESSYHDNRFVLSSDITLSFTGTGSLGLPLLLPLACAWSFRRWTSRKRQNRRS